jgi:integral membrane protein (TIGR01906 family)
VKSLSLGRYSGAFWGALTAVGLPLVIGALAALAFNRAFVIFHSIFFPGKDNWLFNPHTDPIILAMPETFFLRCGILIVGSIILISLAMILCCRKNRNSTAKFEVKL